MPAKVLLCPVLKPAMSGHTGRLGWPIITERSQMRISRRTILKGAGALPLAAGNLGFAAFAQAQSAAPGAAEIPPVVFVHGNGEQAPLWMTTLWRMETNGVPRDRMLAVNFTDPPSRTDDPKPEPKRSPTEGPRPEPGGGSPQI